MATAERQIVLPAFTATYAQFRGQEFISHSDMRTWLFEAALANRKLGNVEAAQVLEMVANRLAAQPESERVVA